MSALLSSLSFMQPALLAALLALPALWYILRITPPVPRMIFFPATSFLDELVSETQTPQKSPLWILLLRIIIAALVIIALARPVLNQAGALTNSGSVRIIMDNSWAGAQNWDIQTRSAEEIIAQAERDNRDLYILPTATPLGEDLPIHYGALAATDALAIIRGLKPQPWPADYDALTQVIRAQDISGDVHTIWLGHGLREGPLRDVVSALRADGALEYRRPAPESLPVLLRPATKPLTTAQRDANRDIRINIDSADDILTGTPVSVSVRATGGQTLDVQSTTLASDDLPQTMFFDIPTEVQNQIARFTVVGRRGAGAIFLLDDQFKRRSVGLVAQSGGANASSLTESNYFLERAIEPFATIATAPLSDLLSQNVSVIILSDVAAMPTETLNALEKWVQDGGVLLRFAGPKMAQSRNEQFLLPVSLRAGGRSLSGAMSWSEPQSIADFDENSLFYGLDTTNNINIKQQILADPAQDLDGKIWAQLSDGTPFITKSSMGRGLLVFVHTTANTQWSDFALSGLYVGVLKRIIQLSGQSAAQDSHSYTSLDPLLIMDGMGGMMTPPASVTPLPISALSDHDFMPSAQHPPGLYGRGALQYALNIGTNLSTLSAVTSSHLPAGAVMGSYDEQYETDLSPFFLYLALALFCLDWIIMMMISRSFFNFNIMRRASSFLLATTLFLYLGLMPQSAQANNADDVRYASGFHLAFIKSGDPSFDQLMKKGLESLSQTLTSRTSVEPKGVVALDPERDDLSFFPLIYWPIGENNRIYSGKAFINIQHYLNHGGTILFDTRDGQRRSYNAPNSVTLRQITASLNIPPIIPIPDDHVLGRAFYLLDEYPGRHTSGTFWVEQNSARGRDNVSSVLIGSNDWAGSWADSYGQAGMNRYSTRYDAQQKEYALRFGVNLVMYVLTGNYKADQVHIPHILERLGE